jgi:hypothetical protein
MSLTLAHAEQSSLDNLERIGLQVDQDTQQPILRGRQRTVPVGRVLPGHARLPIEAPGGHVALIRGLKGKDQLLKFVHGETSQIQDLCRACLESGELSRAHSCGLLSLEA